MTLFNALQSNNNKKYMEDAWWRVHERVKCILEYINKRGSLAVLCTIGLLMWYLSFHEIVKTAISTAVNGTTCLANRISTNDDTISPLPTSFLHRLTIPHRLNWQRYGDLGHLIYGYTHLSGHSGPLRAILPQDLVLHSGCSSDPLQIYTKVEMSKQPR